MACLTYPWLDATASDMQVPRKWIEYDADIDGEVVAAEKPEARADALLVQEL
jgi:hypothetical protein